MPDLDDLLLGDPEDIDSRYEGYMRIVRAVCLVLGPVFLGAALVFVVSSYRFLHRCVPANGSIVQLIPEFDQGNKTVSYRPVFRFPAGNGKTYEVRANTASNPPHYQVGQLVRVLYETGNPTGAKLDSFFSLWGMPFVFAIIGIVATGVGLAIRRYERWLDRRGLSIAPRDPELPVS